MESDVLCSTWFRKTLLFITFPAGKYPNLERFVTVANSDA